MKKIIGIGLILALAFSFSPVIGHESQKTDADVVNFTFDHVDIPTFVKLIGGITGKRFVVGDNVDGSITVVSPKVSRSEVYPLFLSILESAGCSVLEDGNILRVVKLTSRPVTLASVIGPDDATPKTGLITKIIRLEHVSADEVKNVLDNKAGLAKGSNVKTIEGTNHLIVTDTASNIRRIEQLVSKIDLPGLARVTEMIKLTYASADDIADELNKAMLETASRADKLRRRLTSDRRQHGSSSFQSDGHTASVVAVPHSNSIIVVGTAGQVRSLKELVKKMDVDVPSGRGRLNAIFLNHLVADETAKNIAALLAKKESKNRTSLIRDISIQSSPSCNALLVDASPGDFEVVKRLVEQLDIAPAQVHINVLIMEVSNSDGFELGVDMMAVDMPSGVGDSAAQGGFTMGDGDNSLMQNIQSGIFPHGLSVGVARGTSLAQDGTLQLGYPGIINIDALKKSGKVKIVSETSLQSQNNKEASVSVVNEIPILKSEISGGAGTSRDVIQNIDRIDVGIKLKITPHVIQGDRVRMNLNPSIEAVIDKGPGDGLKPTIARRQVDTTVTVDDKHTIVIAGLTREDQIENEKKFPILGSIPLLGWLFRHKVKSKERTDIIIFVTPTIVSDNSSADSLRANWEDKTGLKKDKEF